MKKTFRTFVAVEITEAIRARAGELIAALSAAVADVKWVDPQNLHLTLKFLGDVHDREIARVCQAVEHGAAEVEPFEIEVRGAGAFPTPARPHTVWLGAGAGAERMVLLHDGVEAALAELGYRKEHRRFQVHLTIGRVRGGGKRGQSPFAGTARRVLRTNGDCPLFPADGIAELGTLVQQHAQFAAGRMTVGKVAVFASTLTSAGPIYEVLGTAPLGARE
jgi:RNA 2',3'-cyclic 3'-phosphodiesterase